MSITALTPSFPLSTNSHGNLIASKKTDATTEKVEKISLSIFNSYVFSMGLQMVGGLTCFAIAISLSPIINPMIPTIFCVSIAAAIVLECIILNKELFFDITFIYISLEKKPWYDPITDHIVLGALPLKNHLPSIKKEEIEAVLSMVEDFELKNKITNAVRSEEWATNKITRLQIPTRDLCPVSLANINKGVNFLHEQITQGKKVYVHCKAGRGRSATIVIAYLLKYGDGNHQFAGYQEAYTYVKRRRPQVNLNRYQKKSIENFIKEYPPIA